YAAGALHRPHAIGGVVVSVILGWFLSPKPTQQAHVRTPDSWQLPLGPRVKHAPLYWTGSAASTLPASASRLLFAEETPAVTLGLATLWVTQDAIKPLRQPLDGA